VGQTPVAHAGNGDFVTGEAGLWAFGALSASFNAEWYRAATPGKPFQVAVQRGVRMYHDQTTRPLHDMRWEMSTLLAHGAFVTMIDKTAYDGRLDPVAYDRIGELLGEAREKRREFGHRPVRDVGLYFSVRSRDGVGRDKPAPWFQGIQGAHKACVYEHLGFGFLFDENLTSEGLGRFPVVCLPNVGILSEREVALLRRYVEDGGNLVITGHGGQFDPQGRPLANANLESLIGAKAIGRLGTSDNWVRLPEGSGVAALAAGIRTGWPFLVQGPATVYAPGRPRESWRLQRGLASEPASGRRPSRAGEHRGQGHRGHDGGITRCCHGG
jgi:hypothetical protein